MPPSVSAEIRAAISPHSTDTSDREWSADDVEASIPNDAGQSVLENFYAFRDEDGDPDTKTAYDFIHHFNLDNEAGAASTRAASNAIAILNGGRGVNPADQPWGDFREEIHDHMAQHLEDAGRDPEDIPELEDRSTAIKNYRNDETRGENLANALNNLYQRVIESDGNEINTKTDLDGMLAQEAGISNATVENIRLPANDPNIDCPPLERLEGFARALSSFIPMTVSELTDRLVSQAEADGCSYENSRSNGFPLPKTRSEVTEVQNQYEKQNGEKERRAYPMVEVRANDGETRRIDGHAAVFDEPTMVRTHVGEFKEVVKPGAFDKALQESDTRYLINHDENKLMGRVSSNTLQLSRTSKGLRYENTPPDTSYANDALEVIKRGDMSESSFGFDVEEEKWIENPDGPPTREIHSAFPLYDVSSVTFPAYSGTDVGLRAEFRSLQADLGINLQELASLLSQSRTGSLGRNEKNRIHEILTSIQNQVARSNKPELEKRKRELEFYRRRLR